MFEGVRDLRSGASRYDRPTEIGRLREIAKRLSPDDVVELLYDSEHSAIHKGVRKSLECKLLPFEVPARLFDG